MQDLFVQGDSSGSDAEGEKSEAVAETALSHAYASDPLRACSTAPAETSMSELPPTWDFSERSAMPTTKDVEQLYDEVRAFVTRGLVLRCGSVRLP